MTKTRDMAMLSAVKKFGNSAGVIIPKPLLAELGAQAGDNVNLRFEKGHIVIERASPPARTGWAEDAQRLAAEGDGGLDWPDFGNDEDAKLTW